MSLSLVLSLSRVARLYTTVVVTSSVQQSCLVTKNTISEQFLATSGLYDLPPPPRVCDASWDLWRRGVIQMYQLGLNLAHSLALCPLASWECPN